MTSNKGYFLAPASSKKAKRNFDDTMTKGVPLERIRPYLTQENLSILAKEEIVFAWANAKEKEGPWHQLKPGDTVIFYAQRKLVAAADVIFKQHNLPLGLILWTANDKDKPWEYVFFLRNRRDLNIPIENFDALSGYKFDRIQGFQSLKEKNIASIKSHIGNIDKFFEGTKYESGRVFVNLPGEVEPELLQKSLGEYKQLDQKKIKKERSGVIDFSSLNAEKDLTGSMGEVAVLKFEQQELIRHGRPDLLYKVQRISLENTFAGYDIISCDKLGNAKHIEVK